MSIADFVACVALASFAGFLGSIILSLLTYLVAQLWRWADDFETPDSVNWWTRLTMMILGRTWDGYYYMKRGSDKSFDEADGNLISGLIWAGIGFLVAVSVIQPLVAVSIAVAVSVLFLFRFVRRLNKKLEAHVSDANAHRSQQ